MKFILYISMCRRTVRELLFEGYEDAVMELGESVLEQSGEYQDEFSGLEDYTESGSGEEEEQTGKEERDTVPLDKFGWFYKVKSCTAKDRNAAKLWRTDNCIRTSSARQWRLHARNLLCNRVGTSAAAHQITSSKTKLDG